MKFVEKAISGNKIEYKEKKNQKKYWTIGW